MEPSEQSEGSMLTVFLRAARQPYGSRRSPVDAVPVGSDSPGDLSTPRLRRSAQDDELGGAWLLLRRWYGLFFQGNLLAGYHVGLVVANRFFRFGCRHRCFAPYAFLRNLIKVVLTSLTIRL